MPEFPQQKISSNPPYKFRFLYDAIALKSHLPPNKKPPIKVVLRCPHETKALSPANIRKEGKIIFHNSSHYIYFLVSREVG
jgi:hypothetical protein